MPRPKGIVAKKITICLSDDTKERLLQWGAQNHINSLSGAITQLIWNTKVKDGEQRGQQTLTFEGKK